MKTITETIQIRKPLTEQQKVEMLADISKSNDKIAEIELQIDDLKERIKLLKDPQEVERNNIAQVLANYKAGFILENIECSVVYDKGIASFYSVDNGEKVDERPISEQEQLSLSENRIDAEKIIRQANEEE
jgi:signal transduction histidine kinase